ncbi:hypothetical protein Pelo_11263 [Pelomyxa schiedti]|nr:hypothetical protein Pelo_11263 [Pelomyxa schiedti]
MAGLQIKVQYKDEIRRTSIAEPATFGSLCAAIKALLPSAVGDLVIKYTDDEGDVVRLSSQEELDTAVVLLKSSGGTLLRLIVEDSAPKTAPSAPTTAQPTPATPVTLPIPSPSDSIVLQRITTILVAMSACPGPIPDHLVDELCQLLQQVASACPLLGMPMCSGVEPAAMGPMIKMFVNTPYFKPMIPVLLEKIQRNLALGSMVPSGATGGSGLFGGTGFVSSRPPCSSDWMSPGFMQMMFGMPRTTPQTGNCFGGMCGASCNLTADNANVCTNIPPEKEVIFNSAPAATSEEEALLTHLESIGYVNKQLNLQLLRTHNNDLEKVINDIIAITNS